MRAQQERTTERFARSARPPRASWLFAVLALSGLALTPHPTSAQEPAASEGPLGNDVFLPTSREALEILQRGDAALAEAKTDVERVVAFEAWRSALAETKPGDTIVVSERETLGIELAVERRLFALPVEHRSEWVQRFEELASGELAAAAFSASALAGASRRNPGTTASVRACLRLADFELEHGAALESRAWCRRGLRQLELANSVLAEDERALYRGALDARLQVAENLSSASPIETYVEEDGAHWTRATRLTYRTRIDFRDSIPRLNPAQPGPPNGLRPGLAFLADGRLAIQSALRVTITTANGDAVMSSFEPTLLLPDSVAVSPAREQRNDRASWPLSPAVDGNNIIVVHGRPTRPGRDNALISMQAPSARPTLGITRPALPKLNWAIVGGLRVDDEKKLHAEPELEELKDAVFEAGPIIVGSRVYATLRQTEGDVRAWLACFESTSGRCLWTRFLAQGSALTPGSTTSGFTQHPLPALPLAARDSKLFIGTNLGAGICVDALDGRVAWSFKNKRRAAGTPGWGGNWPPTIAPASSSGVVLWAPLDSDYQYVLTMDSAASPLAHPPRPIGEALALVGGDEHHSLVLSLAGPRRVLSSRGNQDGTRFDSPYLGREENFRGRGASSPERALFSTDRGLYLLDRTRELYLLDYQSYPSHPLPLGGDVLARGSRVFVVSEASLWTFTTH